MRLVRFVYNNKICLGAVRENRISNITERLDGSLCDMKMLIAQWDSLRSLVEAIDDKYDLDVGDANLLAPVSRPGKIWGIGFNYADHGAEAGIEIPEYQTWFAMAQTTLAAPFQPLEMPRVSNALDYEAELVAVVGKGGRNIPHDQAAGSIFGYCCGNDVSVRDWQLRSGQHSIGKSFDGHAPIGPWIVTVDEIDPENLPIRCKVNGEVRQESNTKHQVFKPSDMMVHLSGAMTMEPGDLLFTGTPGGVGALMEPPSYLKVGDTVRVEIDGIGAIASKVVPEAAKRSFQ